MAEDILTRMELRGGSGLLQQEDFEAVKSLEQSIRHDWRVKPIFRTETECRISVLNQVHFPDPHSKYWQAVREQQVHFEQLVYLDFDYQELKLDIEELEEKLTNGELGSIDCRRIGIKLRRKLYDLAVCEKVGEERVREVTQWARIKAELVKKHPKEVFVDNADAEVYQLKSYTKTFILEMFNSGPGTNIGAADAQNIIGKARTAIARCKEVGIWKDIRQEMQLSRQQLMALGEIV